VHGGHAPGQDGAEQRRRVAVAHDRLRRSRERAEVEARDDALGAVSAARAEEGAHRRVVEHALQVGAPDAVLTGQVGVPRADPVPEHHA